MFLQANVSLSKLPKIIKGEKVVTKVGRGWFYRFINRHPNLTQRKSELISESGFQVTQSDLKAYHEYVRLKFEEDGEEDILDDDGSRSWTLDEIGFCMNCKASKYIYYKSIPVKYKNL
jgi:hypothetical protein